MCIRDRHREVCWRFLSGVVCGRWVLKLVVLWVGGDLGRQGQRLGEQDVGMWWSDGWKWYKFGLVIRWSSGCVYLRVLRDRSRPWARVVVLLIWGRQESLESSVTPRWTAKLRTKLLCPSHLHWWTIKIKAPKRIQFSCITHTYILIIPTAEDNLHNPCMFLEYWLNNVTMSFESTIRNIWANKLEDLCFKCVLERVS